METRTSELKSRADITPESWDRNSPPKPSRPPEYGQSPWCQTVSVAQTPYPKTPTKLIYVAGRACSAWQHRSLLFGPRPLAICLLQECPCHVVNICVGGGRAAAPANLV